MWDPHKIRNQLENLKNKFHFRMPQMQTLLCQERFLLRLYQLKEGKNYIWKGGSLLVRLYQPMDQKPRFTVDLDLEAWNISLIKTEKVFKNAMNVDLKDGFSLVMRGYQRLQVRCKSSDLLNFKLIFVF